MTSKKKQAPIYKYMAWLISSIAFLIGFWHTHLGLREFNILGSEYGSILVAGLLLMVMILGYASAVSGSKVGLVGYFLCALTFFVFNLNSFYPTYLGRTLIKEETKALSDSISIYKSRLDRIVGVESLEYYQKVQDLKNIKENVLREIGQRGGFGPYATKELNKFNELANSKISPDRDVGRTKEAIEEKTRFYSAQLNEAIDDFFVKSLSGEEQGALKLVEAFHDMEDIEKMYSNTLAEIMEDNSEVDIDLIKVNPQIKVLQGVITDLDKVAIAVNSVKKPSPFGLFNKDSKSVHPLTQYLGTFQHTISSIFQRLKRLDTLGVIGVSALIDFFAPLSVYFFIRRKEDDEADESTINLWHRIIGKQQPSKF